ncbi:ATP-binding cassette sub-family A member 2 [Drosophila serrata]|uniref:ATP-binding cassette sub-family A member 2 n=1 Tax=Drosophila serrata TaxID=7274 RepID=UPI000A1D02DE|nr:ATP-binding cassette sub-family A member 2 [Drosophila serrata]
MTIRKFIRKLCLMNWKNWKVQMGNPLQLVFILLCPPMFICVAVGMRLIIPMRIRSDKVYDAIDLQRCWLEMVEKLENGRKVANIHNITRNPWTPNLVIGWAPQDFELFREIMANAEERFDPMKVIAFNDCNELRQKMVSDSMFAGICINRNNFKKKFKSSSEMEIKPHFSYSIIMPSELRQLNRDFRRSNWYTLYPDDPQTIVLQRLNHPYDGGFVGYVREGFILIQKFVSESFLNLISRKTVPEIVLRRFPVLGSREDPLMDDLDNGLSLLILVGYLFPSLIFIWQIVNEKHNEMRLFFVNMGIGNVFQFFSWYLTCFVCFILSSVIIVILLKVPWNLNDAVLTQTPWYVLLLVVAFYCTVVASFVVMMASFFNDPHTAVRVATLVWVAFHMPNFVLWNNMTTTAWVFRYISYLIPNVVLNAMFECITDRETIIHSMHLSFSYNFSYRNCQLSVYTGIWIFLVTSLIYCIIGLYMDIWRMGDRSAKRVNREEARANSMPDEPYHDWAKNDTNHGRGMDVNSTKIYEVEPSNRRFKLKIKKLCKRFGAKDRPVLNLFTWNVYENEVTVLMGHNGCGKTTLFKILAGLIEPSRGSITVGNHDMLTERKAACMEVGLALGTKMLIHDLTVLDHLRFMCRVKGMHRAPDIDGHVSYFMHALRIDHLKDKRLKKLMPHHLVLVSICCAFVGNSSIILIDDIYSDLDTPTKALIWALINEEKSHRTIIVVVNTTMLAESISDRLAIMSNGELKCTGTKPFLKNMYGHGFRLVCSKGRNCNVPALIELMNSHLPNMTIESNYGFKVNFVLENKDEDYFPALIDDLEEHMERLDVISFRIRDTSTEEIFLRFGCDEEDQMGGTLGYQDNPNVLINKYFATLADAEPNRRGSGLGLWLLHLRAIVKMRLTIDIKHWHVLLIEILTFIIATLCIFSGAFIYGKNYELVPKTYNLSNIVNAKVFSELVSDDKDIEDIYEHYKECLHWYDAKVDSVDRTHDGSYALTQNNEFSQNVNMAYLFGATFDKNLLTAWFNNIPLHIAPITLNVIHNAIARNFLDVEATIDVTLEPLGFQTNINLFPPGTQSFGVTIASIISFVLCFITTAHALLIIRERSGHVKKQQFLAGARQLSYWTFTILYNVVCQFMFIIVLVIMVIIYQHPQSDVAFILMLLLAIVMAGLLKTLVTHLVASRCRHPMFAFMVVSLISCIGLLMFEESYRHTIDELPKWLMIFHQYISALIIVKLFNNYTNKLYCSDKMVAFTSINVYKCQTNPNCCIEEEYTHNNHGIVWDFLVLATLISVASILLFLSEYYNLIGFGKCQSASKKNMQPANQTSHNSQVRSKISDDPSALIEREKSPNLSPEERKEQALVAMDLVNMYGKVKVLKGANLTLAKGECLNINGLNDSGRSTLLKVIVREAKLSSGEIWIRGYSVSQDRNMTYRMVGYAPQRDNLHTELSPQQMLYIQALFHGHPKQDARKVVDALIKMLGLHQCFKRPSRFCTTGEERRLSFAFAILSKPELVCVDGVPAGLDPVAKRIILTVTTIMQAMGSAFLYTSLPILDMERLCWKRSVMFNGEIWTIRPIENKDHNFRNGYQLEVRFKRKVNPNLSLSRSTWNRINHFPLSPHRKFSAFMEIKFPTAVLSHEDETSMVFNIDLESTTFSAILQTIRRDAFEMNIEDYFISRNIRITNFADR